jgi:hypothetical protein
VELGRRGRKRRLAVEDGYWKLVLEGVGTVEACRLVGIGRKTGYRWRVERGVHLARGQIGLAVAALGAYDTHAYTTEGTGDRRGRHADYSGWFSQTVAATRARLEPGAVADASTAAQTKNLDQLIHELILQPAGDHT